MGAVTLYPLVTPADADTALIVQGGALKRGAVNELVRVALPCFIGDESTPLTAGVGKYAFRVPFAFVLDEVRAAVTVAPTGAAIVVDVNEAGASVLSTPISIDATEKTSTTAAAPPVISDAALADDAEITIDIDAVGSTIAGAGLKVWLIGRRG